MGFSGGIDNRSKVVVLHEVVEVLCGVVESATWAVVKVSLVGWSLTFCAKGRAHSKSSQVYSISINKQSFLKIFIKI